MSEVRQLVQQIGGEVVRNKRTDGQDRSQPNPTLQTTSANNSCQQRRTADWAVQRVISIRQVSPPTSLSSTVRLVIYYFRLPVSVAKEMLTNKCAERDESNESELNGSLQTANTVFTLLDTLRPTATGLDQIPAWFLKIAASLLCKPLANLFNLSIMTSTVTTA